MLASVYSYRVMVKSISCCCVRGRWVLSNPVTNKCSQASDAFNESYTMEAEAEETDLDISFCLKQKITQQINHMVTNMYVPC